MSTLPQDRQAPSFTAGADERMKSIVMGDVTSTDAWIDFEALPQAATSNDYPRLSSGEWSPGSPSGLHASPPEVNVERASPSKPVAMDCSADSAPRRARAQTSDGSISINTDAQSCRRKRRRAMSGDEEFSPKLGEISHSAMFHVFQKQRLCA